MQSESFLDVLIARFRDRWETNPQYRAAMSGVLALVTLIALCSCAGIVSSVAGNVLMASGLGPTSNANPQQGSSTGGLVQGAAVFPIVTPALPTPINTPAADPAPMSQTPAPTPTSAPTPTPPPTVTPCITGCGGGGGGGSAVTVSVTSWSPTKWIACPGSSNCDSVTVHTSVPNTGVNLIITACNNATVLSASSNPNATTDGNGNYTFSFNGQGPKSQPTANVWVTAAGGDANGAHGFPPCG